LYLYTNKIIIIIITGVTYLAIVANDPSTFDVVEPDLHNNPWRFMCNYIRCKIILSVPKSLINKM